MSNKLNIINALEAARQAQGVTQAELASRAGTSRMTVVRIEAGFDPRLSTVYELARALGLELTLVPKSLASEVQAFLCSGGRSLAQPSGVAAPPSVVDLAAVVTVRPGLTAQQPKLSRSDAKKSHPPLEQTRGSARGQSLSIGASNPAQTNKTGKRSIQPQQTGKLMISERAAQVLAQSQAQGSSKAKK